jgi:NAD-dependent dihydropyrimidine dehydrogenase PreA subunit
MPYFIASPCIDVMDKSCIEECPVDCIYEGNRKLYINPGECIDCGACEPVCPEGAIYVDWRAPAEAKDFVADNDRFFADPLPGRDGPLGSPGGSRLSGRIGTDTPLAATWQGADRQSLAATGDE